jgi:hypothetical protein
VKEKLSPDLVSEFGSSKSKEDKVYKADLKFDAKSSTLITVPEGSN